MEQNKTVGDNQDLVNDELTNQNPSDTAASGENGDQTSEETDEEDDIADDADDDM